MRYRYLCLIPCVLSLSACGETKSDRTLSGGLIGAGAGAVVGAFAGAPVVGAAVGASVGAVAGDLTNKAQIDLGKPLWR